MEGSQEPEPRCRDQVAGDERCALSAKAGALDERGIHAYPGTQAIGREDKIEVATDLGGRFSIRIKPHYPDIALTDELSFKVGE
jgi:hypothetical protein